MLNNLLNDFVSRRKANILGTPDNISLSIYLNNMSVKKIESNYDIDQKKQVILIGQKYPEF